MFNVSRIDISIRGPSVEPKKQNIVEPNHFSITTTKSIRKYYTNFCMFIVIIIFNLYLLFFFLCVLKDEWNNISGLNYVLAALPITRMQQVSLNKVEVCEASEWVTFSQLEHNVCDSMAAKYFGTNGIFASVIPFPIWFERWSSQFFGLNIAIWLVRRGIVRWQIDRLRLHLFRDDGWVSTN